MPFTFIIGRLYPYTAGAVRRLLPTQTKGKSMFLVTWQKSGVRLFIIIRSQPQMLLLWMIPLERMKSQREEHRVPLPDITIATFDQPAPP